MTRQKWSEAMPDQIEEIRLRWIAEHEEYDRFRVVASGLLEHTLKKIGISARVTSRLKAIDSLLRKAIKQRKEGRDPTFDSFLDKVGIRAVVRFKEEVEEAANAVKRAFHCVKIEFKSEGRRLNEFGYESCHMDVTLREDHADYSSFGLFPAELQIRTIAQDLWADMAHELSYKSVLRDSAPELQAALDRRIYILSALVESADMEFSRINEEILASPGADNLLLLRTLEREYFKFTSRPYDRELSIECVEMLTAIHRRSLHETKDELERFSRENETRLAHVFADQASNQDRSVFLFQPEVILIFEYLEYRPLALEEIWERHFPARELERVATAWGVSVF